MRVNYDVYGGIPLNNPVVYEYYKPKNAGKRLLDSGLDGLIILPLIPAAGPARALTGPILAAKLPSNIIPSIARQFRNFECMDCVDAIVTTLQKEGINGQILDMVTSSDKGLSANIWSDTAGKLISTNGKHRTVLVGEKVYDNVHPDGINYGDWLNDFHTPAAGGLKVNSIDF